MIRMMSDSSPRPFHPRDPLHGITLKMMVEFLHQKYGWETMAERIPIRCFQHDPSVKSSLTFLRKTSWAREKVERWYIRENRSLRGNS
ncbi:MAG: hypothetical protein RLZZ224_1011 [Verrucomicrobiota bacterium]|jgi:uncharacterized protein (DUF2132 family)